MLAKKVVVGLSGGVDSAVTAKLMVDQGYEVIGIFMKNWDDKDDPHCPAAVDAIDARNVAETLNIPFYTVNFSKEYWEDVFEYFLEEHRQCRTPNPDILCNKYIKFRAFLDHAEKLGADYLATGHYARNYFNEATNLHELQAPKDANKDQTYFLYTLGQTALAKTLFPLADLTKPEIRQIAKDAGFANAGKKDSTGICMVGERDYMEFLKKYIHQEPGNIVSDRGDVIGKHIGLSFYTLGQRKNLNVGGVKGYEEKPWVVLEKNLEKNELIACQDPDNPKLFTSELKAHKLHWVAGHPPSNSFGCDCQVRYRQEAEPCEVQQANMETIQVTFQNPQRAITPGQSIVFYDGKVCLGGGEIL